MDVVTRISELGMDVLQAFSRLFDTFTIPFSQVVGQVVNGNPSLPSWAIELLRSVERTVISLFPNASLLTLMVGGGLVGFMLYTVVKWVVGLVS